MHSIFDKVIPIDTMISRNQFRPLTKPTLRECAFLTKGHIFFRLEILSEKTFKGETHIVQS